MHLYFSNNFGKDQLCSHCLVSGLLFKNYLGLERTYLNMHNKMVTYLNMHNTKITYVNKQNNESTSLGLRTKPSDC